MAKKKNDDESRPEIPKALGAMGITLTGAEVVKLGRGVLGKLLLLWAALVGPIGLAAWGLHSDWMRLGLGLATIGAGIWFSNRVLKFAEKNPAAMLLQGAEFLRHQELQFAAKERRLSPKGHRQRNPKRAQPALPDRSSRVVEVVPETEDEDEDEVVAPEARKK